MRRSLKLMASTCAAALVLGCATATPECKDPSAPVATPSTPPAPAPAEHSALVAPAPAASSPPTATAPSARAPLPAPEPDQNTGVVDPAPVNAALAKACGAWTFDQLLQHLTGTGPDRMKLEIEVYQKGQRAIGGAAADEARVLVERNDLLDDSIKSERHRVTLRLRTKDDAPHYCAGWFVEKATVEWRCVRGAEQGRWVKHWCP